MRKSLVAAVAVVAEATGAVLWWRRHPRVGAETVNRVINPWLLRQGVEDLTHGEIARLEHVGRVSGTVRVTPVHPVRSADGVRIIVPLGAASEWARNVLAAGHCRVELDGTVLELDTPRLVDPIDVQGMPAIATHVMSRLGFRYLLLRRFDERPGSLDEPTATTAKSAAEHEPEPDSNTEAGPAEAALVG